jgi:hypothetical protein
MKFSQKNLIGILFITGFLALTGCGGGGGGGSSAPVASANAASGTPLQFGQGHWSNGINVSNTGLYQNFLSTNGLCGLGACNGSLWVTNLVIDTTTTPGGMLPGLVTFSLGTQQAGFAQQGTQAVACGNAAGNGLIINYFNTVTAINPAIAGLNYGNLNVANNLCQLVANPGQVPLISIQAQWVDPGTRTTLNTQVYYQGSLMATGYIDGTVQNFGSGVFTGGNYPGYIGSWPYASGQTNAVVVFRQSGMTWR